MPHRECFRSQKALTESQSFDRHPRYRLSGKRRVQTESRRLKTIDAMLEKSTVKEMKSMSILLHDDDVQTGFEGKPPRRAGTSIS